MRRIFKHSLRVYYSFRPREVINLRKCPGSVLTSFNGRVNERKRENEIGLYYRGASGEVQFAVEEQDVLRSDGW